MFLPNAHMAIVNAEKITGYVLNFEHYEGKNKARVFEAVFGLDKLNGDDLIKAIKKAILKCEAVQQSESVYGIKYTVDFEFTFNNKTAIVRTGWIVDTKENIPRLITCYVKL